MIDAWQGCNILEYIHFPVIASFVLHFPRIFPILFIRLLTILFLSCTNLFLSLDFNFPNTYPLETNSNSFSFSLLLPPPSFDQLTFRRTCSPAANETARFLISRAEQLMRIRNCEVNLAVAVFAATLHQIHPRRSLVESKNVEDEYKTSNVLYICVCIRDKLKISFRAFRRLLSLEEKSHAKGETLRSPCSPVNFPRF